MLNFHKQCASRAPAWIESITENHSLGEIRLCAFPARVLNSSGFSGKIKQVNKPGPGFASMGWLVQCRDVHYSAPRLLACNPGILATPNIPSPLHSVNLLCHNFSKGRCPKKKGIFWEFFPKGGRGSSQFPKLLQINQVIFGMPKSFLGAKTCFTIVGRWYLINLIT